MVPPDSLRRPDNLRIAASSLEDAENPRIEDRDDLGQSGENCDLGDSCEKLAKHEVQAALGASTLAVHGGGANPRAFPNCRALDDLTVFQQARENIA